MPELADRGDVSMAGDHKHVHRKQGDPEKKSFGISALIADPYGYQLSVLLEYIPTNSSSAAVTMPMIEATLIKFNLMKAFKESKISFSVDGAMIKTIVDLFEKQGLQPIVTYCQVHNIDNIMKRTVEHNIDEYLTNGAEQYRTIQRKISAASKELEQYLKNTEVSARNKNKVIKLFQTSPDS